jgi:hypothetical protein
VRVSQRHVQARASALCMHVLGTKPLYSDATPSIAGMRMKQSTTPAYCTTPSVGTPPACAIRRVFTTSTGVEKMAETVPAMPEAPKWPSGPSGTPAAMSRVLASS